MGMWAAIKSLFVSEKVVETGLDLATRAADAIDAVFYTDEEKAEARRGWWTDVFLPLEKTLAPQGAIRSVTRRMLARAFCQTFLFLIIAAFVVYPINPGWSKYAIGLVKILAYPVSGIVLFFFGAYGVGTYLVNKKNGEQS